LLFCGGELKWRIISIITPTAKEASVSDSETVPEQDDSFILRTKVSGEMNLALDRMTILTGVSKSSLVKQAIAMYLITLGVEAADEVLAANASPSRGRLGTVRNQDRKVKR
jgi:hypothetical protein